jgi:hypothetical protein
MNILRNNGFSPLPECSGLTKNMRKRRNRKIKHAALHGGSGGISALLSSREYTDYIDPTRIGKKVNSVVQKGILSHLPGIGWGGNGGWGRLPNVSSIDYAEDDSRGWTHVDHRQRRRRCMIEEDEYQDEN